MVRRRGNITMVADPLVAYVHTCKPNKQSDPIMAETIRHFLERVLASNLLVADLVQAGECGATDDELAMAPPLPAELRDLLAWRNGLDLEVVRLHGVGDAVSRVTRWDSSAVEFASDPAGFVYLAREDGAIVSVDHDGGEQRVVAKSVDDFLRGYIFGPRAAQFGGDDWDREVRAKVRDG